MCVCVFGFGLSFKRVVFLCIWERRMKLLKCMCMCVVNERKVEQKHGCWLLKI